MKQFILTSMLFTLIVNAATAKTNHANNADLLGMWQYTIQHVYQNKVQSETHDVYYFFNDNTYVVANEKLEYDAVLKLKNAHALRWEMVNKNLIIFTQTGEQKMAIFSENDTQKLISGVKTICAEHQLKTQDMINETNGWYVSIR